MRRKATSDKGTGSKVEPTQVEAVATPEDIDAPDQVAEEGAEVIELVEPEVPLDPLEVAQRRVLELEARLRTVSKAFNDQKQEMASFRERTEQQIRARGERVAFETVQTFFDPVQNLKRSLAAEKSHVSTEGLRMVLHQFMASMTRLGLREVPGEGSDFDPNYHEALAVMPVGDPERDGKVLIVHSDGYVVGGRVLQAAQVVIGKYEEGAEPPEA